MHSIRGGLVARTYAFAASNNDTGGKKLRIRRSKEERKTMVESFIKKYQISNGGDFPSLNLTHKEVGGSFYTVREIVREIIQENRVLAPPKKQDQFDNFLEQNPLGSISVEPDISFSVSHVHSETLDGSPNSTVSMFHERDAIELANEQIVDGLQVESEKDGGGNNSKGHTLPNHSQQHTVGEDSNTGEQPHQPEETITANEDVQKNAQFDKPHTTDDVPIDCVENTGSALETSNFVVETFPLRPFARTVTATDDHALNHPVSGNKIDDVKLQGSAGKSNDESQDSARHSSTSESDVVNVHDHAKQLEPKDSLQSLNKVSSLKTEHSNTVGSKTKRDSSNVAKQSSPTLDRVHLETWKGTSKKSKEGETNPLIAFVKALISAWTKLWS